MFLHKAVITSSQTIAFLNHFVMTPRAHYLIISSPYHFDLMSVTLPRPPPPNRSTQWLNDVVAATGAS